MWPMLKITCACYGGPTCTLKIIIIGAGICSLTSYSVAVEQRGEGATSCF